MEVKILESDIDEFKEYLRASGKNRNTISSYTTSIKGFKKFLDENPFDSWDKAVLAYLANLSNNAEVSTMRHSYAVIRAYAHFKKIPEVLLMRHKWARSQKLPSVLTTSQRIALEKIAMQTAGETGEYNLILAVLLMTRLGLRISEVINLKREDINTREWTLRLTGKGSKTAILPIPNALKPHIRYALKLEKNGKLFNYSRTTLWRRIKELGRRLGIDLKPHTLRHTCATELLKKGVNLRAVQKVLRHSSLATTQVYTHLTVDDIREELKKAWEE
ncbi:tyrosine-type recombinase/integrase [bacterium]|nr:tyrosine-type recombinase/integrase [bacterium]